MPKTGDAPVWLVLTGDKYQAASTGSQGLREAVQKRSKGLDDSHVDQALRLAREGLPFHHIADLFHVTVPTLLKHIELYLPPGR